MSNVFRRGSTYYVKLRSLSGEWTHRTCETSNGALAKSMGRMVEELGYRGKQKWGLLDAVLSGQLSLARLYAAFAGNKLDELEERMRDIDISPLVDAWLAAQVGRSSADTIAHYRVHVRSLILENAQFFRSNLTFERLASWLSKTEGSNGTRRKYHAAMSGFCCYLRACGVIRQNPMQDVKAPPAAPSRRRYLEHEDVQRIVQALDEPYRTIVAVLHGTGIEISVLLDLHRRDIDFDRAEIRARGTKTRFRDRIATIEPWAMDYLRRHTRELLPNAKVFPDLNRWTVSDKHRVACKSLEIEDYTLRDSRHTYAVRAVRAGASFEAVAQQLGHSDTTMVVRVYSRFKPSARELQDWHTVAAMQDAARAAK
jgi:integrase